MRTSRYLKLVVISATFLLFLFWQTANAGPHEKPGNPGSHRCLAKVSPNAGPPKKPGNPGLPGCLAKVSELNDIVEDQQETIDQQETRIEELESMLQNFAPVPKTGYKQYFDDGEDGHLQKGVQWPNPRFTDNDDGTVTDNLTGLIWLKNANCYGKVGWYPALDGCYYLADGDCGLNDGSIPGDWRLPNIRELHSLIDFGTIGPMLPSGHPFTDVQVGTIDDRAYYRSSTGAPGGSTYNAWIVDFRSGNVITKAKDGYFYVWPVRGGD